MNCPKCNKLMENLGNASKIIYTSSPPQWDETWICEPCKLRKDVRVYGHTTLSAPNLSDYHDIDD